MCEMSVSENTGIWASHTAWHSSGVCTVDFGLERLADAVGHARERVVLDRRLLVDVGAAEDQPRRGAVVDQVLGGDIAAERVPEQRPVLEPELLREGLDRGGLAGHASSRPRSS